MDPGIRTLSRLIRPLRKWAITTLFHRMKPTRIRMCHSLVMNYGLYKKMEIFVRHLPIIMNITYTPC